MTQPDRRIVVAQWAGLLAALAVMIPTELQHLRDAQQRHWSDWFIGINVDTTPLLILLCVLPYFWFIRRPFWTLNSDWWRRLSTWWGSSHETGWLIAATLIAATSLGMLASVSVMCPSDAKTLHFGDLPPSYHDEFSYLFQAKSYLAGRLSFESHPTAARLFDQMHVVNEGRFASRYFPATGLFIAPWLWLGWPILGHWLAGAATCVLVFGIGRELSNNGTGFVAGMLIALSPGMALFGNLLLAHHPTLLGLFFFAWSFLRWLRRGLVFDAAIAGIGLSWAMLCRPMTAAGFALPFGVAFVWRLWQMKATGYSTTTLGTVAKGPRTALRMFIAMALPLVVGFILLGIHNHAITGSATRTAYELFNDIYTPRHVYGFDNVVRGEQHLGPRVLDNYDRWAVNLTPALAIENTYQRLIASWQWTLGLMPLLVAAVVFVLTRNSEDRRWWLIFASIVSLFVAHVPYWFTGIMNWHYVFESGPLWCLLLAATTDRLCRSWLSAERPRMPIWWSMFVGVSVLANLIDIPPLWYPSKLEAVVVQTAFSRLKYRAFDELLKREVRQRPALVLIEADPADRHIDHVVNDPNLSGEIVRGRWPVHGWSLEKVASEFPNRAVYVVDVNSSQVRLISKPGESHGR